MPTVKATVEELSRQLNDQQLGFEYTRWTRIMLINYISDALVQVALYRPDAFTTTVGVTLVPGIKQQLPDGVTSLVSFVDPLNVTNDDFGLTRAFNKRACSEEFDCHGNVVYTVGSYNYDLRNPKYFFVSPPVPEGLAAPAVVSVSCATSPPVLDNTSWLAQLPVDNKYYNAVLAWAQSKAYEVDTESESSFRLMQFHRSEFYKMMGVKYTMDSKFNSGWYLGQRGDEANVKGQQ
jgi:hypothetical protein